MRTTHSMMRTTFLRNLYNNNNVLNTYQNQLSSGKRMSRASDDPIGTVRSIQTRKAISLKEDFQETVKEANDMLTQTESCLSDANTILQRIKELTVMTSSEIYDLSQREAVAAEVEQLRDELIDIGNCSFNGRFIFAGHNSTNAPFELDDAGTILFNGVDMTSAGADIEDMKAEKMYYQVDSRTAFDISVNGAEYLGTGEDNICKILDDMVTLLRTDDENYSGKAMTEFNHKIGDAVEKNLALITEVGARQTRLQLMDSRYEDDLLNLKEKKSNIEDIEQAEVITAYKYAYVAYEQSLSVGAQILQPSLLDYLR